MGAELPDSSDFGSRRWKDMVPVGRGRGGFVALRSTREASVVVEEDRWEMVDRAHRDTMIEKLWEPGLAAELGILGAAELDILGTAVQSTPAAGPRETSAGIPAAMAPRAAAILSSPSLIDQRSP